MGSERIEQTGEPEITSLVRHDGHLVDLGNVVHIVDDGRCNIVGVLDHFAHTSPAVRSVELVGVKDELWFSELLEVFAGGKKNRAPPFGAVLNERQVLLAELVVSEVAFVAAGYGRAIQNGPVEPVGGRCQEAATRIDDRPAGEERFVPSPRIVFGFVAKHVGQSLRFAATGIVRDVVLFRTLPLVTPQGWAIPVLTVGRGCIVDVLAEIPPFPDSLFGIPLRRATALQRPLPAG